MDDLEETNVRLLVGDSSKEIQEELDTILQYIPPLEQTSQRSVKIITDI